MAKRARSQGEFVGGGSEPYRNIMGPLGILGIRY